jgi:hypothetical protein
LGIDVHVRVVAEDRDAEADESLRVLVVEVGDEEIGAVEGGFGQGRGEGDVVAGRAQHRLHLAAQQQVGGDSHDPSH